MFNQIAIDDTHRLAISREIGERLRAYLKQQETDFSEPLRAQIDRLHELDATSDDKE